MKIVEFKNVWEKYRIKFVRERRVSWEEIWALKNINFELNKGEVVGIIGENGAGKTTLLKLLAGMIRPDRGEIEIQGKVSSLMELGAGFHPELTGRENVYLNSNLYGLTVKDMDEKIDEIIKFTGINKFIDAPIKYYSQGMYMRLAFALAVHVEPDIFLIDDILAVGDEGAQRKCLNKIFELKKTGKSIVLVSHDMNMIHKLCDRAIFLKEGGLIQDGSSETVIYRYLETAGDKKGIAELKKGNLRIVFNNGKILLNWKGLSLTKHFGGYSSFYHLKTDTWYFSINADWQVKRLSANELLAEGIYHHLPIRQIWRIKLEDENQFTWQVTIKSEDSSIREKQAGFFLVPQYKEWFSLDEHQQFPRFSFKQDWLEMSPDNVKRIFLALGRGVNEEGGFPFLSLEVKKENCFLKVLNTGYDTEARVIQGRFMGDEVFSGIIRVFSEAEKFKTYIQGFKEQYEKKGQKDKERYILSHTISKGPVKVYADAETKSVRLYYKEREITKLNGLHSSFEVGGCWYNTNSCEWKVEKKDEELFLTFFWPELSFCQKWRVFLNKDREIGWDIDLKLEKPINFSLLKAGMSLSADYKRWFCSYQTENFPLEFTSWQDMPIKDKKTTVFGLGKEKKLPAIVLEYEDNKGAFSALVQNSDRRAKCRILQTCLINKEFSQDIYNYFRGKIMFLDDEKEIIEEQKRIFIAASTISKGDLKVYVDVETKSLRIYYKEKEITSGEGFLTLLEGPKIGRLDSGCFSWEVIKKSSEKINIILHYQPLEITQMWTLICQDENALKIDIDLEIEKKPLFLINQGVFLSAANNYSQWRTRYEKGDLSVCQYIGGVGPVRLKYNRVSKVVLEGENGGYFPKLTFDCSFLEDARILGVNRRKDKESTLVGSSKLVPRKRQEISAGKYKFFSGRIVLDRDVSLEENGRKSSFQINKGSLKVAFEEGRGRIFWKDKELTFGLGLYTSIRSSGIWYDSAQALWQRKSIEKDRMIFSGEWPYLPISQVWQIRIISENLIYWKVEMEIHSKTDLEIEQSNLMLLNQYRDWTIPDVREGKFLDEFTEEYDIFPFRFWYGKVTESGIKAKGKGMPSFLFQLKPKDDSFRSVIENTDCLYKARLLQYQKSTPDKRVFSGRYKYFEGVIKIEP